MHRPFGRRRNPLHTEEIVKLATYSAAGEQRVGAVVGDDNIVVDLAAVDRVLARQERRKTHPFFS